nr:hypothetical protein [Tanacetum cinerariifolium]
MRHQRKKLKIMMAYHVHFDIQTIIIKKLPAKSLLRFRCVSKQWKSLIDSSEFIKNYQSMNAPHLLVRYNVRQYDDNIDGYISIIDEYVSIIDNDTFPQHMSPITVPLSVQTLERARISRILENLSRFCWNLGKNGEAIIETRCANTVDANPILQVYDPCSGHVNDIRIPWSGHDDIGKTDSFFSISSYMETLLLLDQ